MGHAPPSQDSEVGGNEVGGRAAVESVVFSRGQQHQNRVGRSQGRVRGPAATSDARGGKVGERQDRVCCGEEPRGSAGEPRIFKWIGGQERRRGAAPGGV